MPHNLICYDAIGKMHNLPLIYSENNESKFDAQSLSTGIYFITMNGYFIKFYKID